MAAWKEAHDWDGGICRRCEAIHVDGTVVAASDDSREVSRVNCPGSRMGNRRRLDSVALSTHMWSGPDPSVCSCCLLRKVREERGWFLRSSDGIDALPQECVAHPARTVLED